MSTVNIFLILLFLHRTFSLENPVIQLPNGSILGRDGVTAKNTAYYAFEKIPYAAPPVDNLRFKAPELPKNWDGVLNTTHIDVACYQIGNSVELQESEDCLFLNVFTPRLPTSKNDEPLAVMFFIHGGAFLYGSSMEYPPDLFVENNVVLITINYRLGIFGFLSTQDTIIPGNNGLKDQLLAIQWAHNNVHLFGGDPEKITIFGESAGAGSCAYHLLNPNSEGLLSGVILESGTFLSPWAYQRNARDIAFSTAAILNNTFEVSDNSEELLEFLQTVDAQNLNTAAMQYFGEITQLWDTIINQGCVFAPVIEVQHPDAFITKKMYGLLQAGNILRVPTLMGFNSEEALFSNQDLEKAQSFMKNIDDNLKLIVPDDMQIGESKNRTIMGERIRDIYTDGEPFVDHVGASIRYSSDNLFTKPVIKHAEMFSKFAKTYLYQFSYDGLIGNISVKYNETESVGHTEELFYLFCTGSNCIDNMYPTSDLLTRQRLITLWTNFAKYQNPTPEEFDLLENVIWPEVVSDKDFLYLDISERLEVKNHPKQETYSSWVQLYDSLDNDDFDTY